MATASLWNRVRGRRDFPPERLLDRGALGLDGDRFQKLERIYHQAQKQMWEGKNVFAELKARHGGIAPLPQAQKDAIGRIFTIILWGELAAWVVAAELADEIDEVEPKMAATSQAFDEARHFYVMRDYLLELGGEIPPLDGFAKTILTDLLATKNLLHKLVGMQLMVENVALSLFRMVGNGVREPVLAELMAYFGRDEARHVGLGTQYLPTMLRGLKPHELVALQLFQLKVMTLLSFGTHYLKDSFETLGLDWRDAIRHGMHTQGAIFKALAGLDREESLAAGVSELERARRAKGVWVPRSVRDLNKWSIAQLFPDSKAELPAWHRATIGACEQIALVAEKALRALA